MQLGTFTDGRGLGYDQETYHFDVGGTLVSASDVAAWDGAGQITWSSGKQRDWFISTGVSVFTWAADRFDLSHPPMEAPQPIQPLYRQTPVAAPSVSDDVYPGCSRPVVQPVRQQVVAVPGQILYQQPYAQPQPYPSSSHSPVPPAGYPQETWHPQSFGYAMLPQPIVGVPGKKRFPSILIIVLLVFFLALGTIGIGILAGRGVVTAYMNDSSSTFNGYVTTYEVTSSQG